MGFRQSDLTPTQVTPITPPGKSHLFKIFEVTTADTVASVKAMLPASASVTNVYYYGDGVADTGEVVTLTIANNSGTISTGTLDAETDGGSNGLMVMSNLPNLESVPADGDLRVSAVTTATQGGPFRFLVEFVA